MLRRLAIALALAAGCGALSNCSTVKFYSQAVGGQMEMLSQRKPVEKFLHDPATDPKLKRQLELTLKLRKFAKEHLNLPAEKQYDTYVDLGRAHVVWVIFATPEFSIDPKTWQYPVIGRLEYRGYFSEEAARTNLAELKGEGLDAIVGGVDAYSSLGYFKDPLLNTFIFNSDVELAELLFHELTHQRTYLPGDTEFNEAFATATAEEGVRRWLKSEGRTADLRSYEEGLREQAIFVKRVLAMRDDLRVLYRKTEPLPEAERRAAKKAAFQRFAREARKLPELRRRKGYQKWFSQELNNAHLNTVSAYHTLTPGFHRLLARHGGNLESYFAEVDGMRRLSKAERRLRLAQH